MYVFFFAFAPSRPFIETMQGCSHLYFVGFGPSPTRGACPEETLKRFLFIGAFALLSGAAFAQSVSGRVFSYNPASQTSALGSASYEFNAFGGNTTPTTSATGLNSVTGSVDGNGVPTGAQFAAPTHIVVDTYLYISGNFAGYFEVGGYGNTIASGSSNVGTNTISIATNRPFTVTASGFASPTAIGGGAGTAGTISYVLTYLNSDNSPIAGLSSTSSLTDDQFNSVSYALDVAHIPATGTLNLALKRTLNLTGNNMVGGVEYDVPGTPTIVFTLN